MRCRVATLALLLALPMPRPAAADAVDDALEQLDRRNISFNEVEFVDLIERDDSENVRLFLQAGMDPNQKDERGQPVILLAAGKGFTATVKELTQAKALLSVHTERGFTPLHLAAMFGHEDTVEALLAAGADARATNEYGMTALHLAVQARRLAMAEALLKAGAPADVEGGTGASPLAIALQTRQDDMLKMFERHGCKAKIAALKRRFAEDAKREDARLKHEAELRDKQLKKSLEAAGGSRGGD